MLGKKEKKEDSKMSLRKIREEIEDVLEGFWEECSDIIENLIEIKVSFESIFSEVINPYGPSVRILYDLKRGVEKFRENFIMTYLEYFAVLPKVILSDLKFFKKTREEDMIKIVGDCLRLKIGCKLYDEIFEDMMEIFGNSLKIIEEFARLMEEIGNQKALIRDKYSKIIERIDDLSSKISKTIEKIEKVKIFAENEALIFIYKEFDPKDPQKIARTLLEEFLKRKVENFREVLNPILDEVRKVLKEECEY